MQVGSIKLTLKWRNNYITYIVKKMTSNYNLPNRGYTYLTHVLSVL